MVVDMRSGVQLVEDFYSAISQGRHGDDLAQFFAPDLRTIEHPNALVPLGRTSSRAEMITASTAGAELLAHQRFEVRWLREVDGVVIARVTWRGTVARNAGPFVAGQELTAHVAQFIRVRDGHLAEIETYDCYEPFAR